MVYSTAVVQTFTHWNRFSLSQHLAIDSKAGPTVTPIMLEIMARRLTTQQQQQKNKNKWLVDSSSMQNKHVLSSTCLLFAKLSLVKVLLLASSQRKMWSLEGTLIFHAIGVKICFTLYC
jgi:hypothetical protein